MCSLCSPASLQTSLWPLPWGNKAHALQSGNRWVRMGLALQTMIGTTAGVHRCLLCARSSWPRGKYYYYPRFGDLTLKPRGACAQSMIGLAAGTRQLPVLTRTPAAAPCIWERLHRACGLPPSVQQRLQVRICLKWKWFSFVLNENRKWFSPVKFPKF